MACGGRLSTRMLTPPYVHCSGPGGAGERIQVHRCGPEKVCYYSRRAIDHGTHSNYFMLDPMFHARVRVTESACMVGAARKNKDEIVWLLNLPAASAAQV